VAIALYLPAPNAKKIIYSNIERKQKMLKLYRTIFLSSPQ
jgi:hypothetical protein